MKDDLGDRQKKYEGISTDRVLIPNLPVLVRIDGKNFRNWTRGCTRPYDENLQKLFDQTTHYLIEQTNAVIGYTQSDEITLILYNYGRPESQILFDGRISKLTSVLASIATAKFNELVNLYFDQKPIAFFDCRVFNVPNETEAVNCLIWRENDAVRNSISMAAQSVYSSKELHKKSNAEKQEMLFQKGINWNDYPSRFKRGAYFRRELVERQFTAEEKINLPLEHEVFHNPEMIIKRHIIKQIDLPILTKIKNRERVIFYGDEPELNDYEKDFFNAEKVKKDPEAVE